MKIDLHTHTSWGSACAYMDPDQLIKRAREVGLDGVCLTEHDQVWRSETIKRLRDKHDFPVFGGVEVSTDLGHILAFGLNEPVLDIYHARDLRRVVDEAGGVMIAAHPFRYEPDPVGSFFFPKASEPDSVKRIETAGLSPVFFACGRRGNLQRLVRHR